MAELKIRKRAMVDYRISFLYCCDAMKLAVEPLPGEDQIVKVKGDELRLNKIPIVACPFCGATIVKVDKVVEDLNTFIAGYVPAP